MKLSRYNVFVKYENDYLGYNTFSNNYIVLDPFLHDLLMAAKAEPSVDELEKYHPQLYQGLISNGFIIDDNMDELASAMAISKKHDLDESSYHLIINPTMNCNFKCWYCYESHIKSSKISLDTRKKIEHAIEQKLKNDKIKSFYLSWFGGEPLLFFNQLIKPISEYTANLAAQYGVKLTSAYTTNGFLIKKEMIPLFKKYNTISFQITLDGHREQHNAIRFVNKDRGSYDEIINNIKLLCRHQLKVVLRINYTNFNIGNIEKIINDLADLSDSERSFLSVSFHKVWQSQPVSIDLLFNKFSLFMQAGFHIRTEFNYRNALKESCYADKKNQATINYNGEVFKCTARDFKSENKEGIITPEGGVSWNAIRDKRINAKFKNSPCLNCKILPICNGGCSQLAIENEDNAYCIYDGDETKKEEVVLNMFRYLTEVVNY